MNRQSFKVAAAVMAFVFSGATTAQNWPAKPVRIVVPFAEGGATDIVARQLGQKLSLAWAQPVHIENKAGAGGNVGAALVAKSPADGYTLLMTSGSVVTANQHMYKSLPFDPAKDLVGVTNVAAGPQVIVVSSSSPIKDLKGLIAYARTNPKKLAYGSAGVGSQTHLAAESFAHAAKIDIIHSPFKGEAAAMKEVLSGEIQMVVANLGGATDLIKEGKLRALGVTSKDRNRELAEVPAISEVLPGFENIGWFGLMVPSGTPKVVVDRVHRDTVTALHSEDLRNALQKHGMVGVGNTPAEFHAAIHRESEKWAKVVEERRLGQ